MELIDLICGVCALIAIILWLLIDLPVYAIIFAIIGDGFAAIPTFKKAWLHPETETGITFFAGFFSTLLMIPVIPVWNVENAGFQLFLLISNGLLFITINRHKIKLEKTNIE